MIQRNFSLRAPLALLCLAISPSPCFGQFDQWSTYGGSSGNIHYSSLKQINRSNVGKLEVAWTYDSGDAFPGSKIECNPIVVEGTLYATTPKLSVIALEAATGKLKWSYDVNQGRRVAGAVTNRGVTFWAGRDGEVNRVLVVSNQYLYALNAIDGQPIATFGIGGRIDLRRDLGRNPEQLFVSDTSPVIAYKDLLIVGTIVSETLPAAPGDVRAYDALTGKLRWSFHTIPHPGEPGYESWTKDAWTYIGGANNWAGMSLDEKRGIVFVPLGSASFDFYGANRIGDNLYSNCLLALDAATGKRIWHFQTVHHDLWDRDLPAPPALVTVMHDGKMTDAAAQITKSGFVYLFDRETGSPLFPIETRKYPQSTVDGEVSSETQPLPTKPLPFARQAVTADILTNRSPSAHETVLARFNQLRSGGQFVPPSLEGTLILPGLDGGGEWGGPAFDPETGYLYVNANEMPWVLRLVPSKGAGGPVTAKQLYLKECAPCHHADMAGSPPEIPSLQDISKRLSDYQVLNVVWQGAQRMPSFSRLGMKDIQAISRFVVHGEDSGLETAAVKALPTDQKYGFDGYNKFLDPDGYPAISPPWGTLSAIDLNTGEYVWKQPFGEYPELKQNTGTENFGGGVVTAGGLFFIAATSFDKKLHAYDKLTGNLLWETTLPAAGNATPAVYQVNGKEYLVIACGGGKYQRDASGSSYVAYALR